MRSWCSLLLLVLVVSGREIEEVFKSRSSTLFGYSQVEADVVNLKFSEDLHMSNDLFCLPLLEEIPSPTCLPCSYENNVCPSNINSSSPFFSSSLPPCSCSSSEACELDKLTRAVVEEVEVSEKTSKVFRYEHSSWSEGFVIQKKAITNYSPIIVVSTSPDFDPTKIVAISSADNILVCPSHPLFGPKDNTITYFISIQPSRVTKIQLLIETLPNDESHGEPTFFAQPVPNVFWNFNYDNLDNGAYMRVRGLDVPEFGDVSPVALLFPFDGCGLYSLRTEVVQYDRSLWVPDIYVGIVTQSEVDSFALFQPGVSNCVTEGCFRTVEYLQLDSQSQAVSQDSVLGFCPKADDQQNYIIFFFTTPLGDWVADIFVRNARTSPFLSSHNIADSFWSYVQIQERLWNLITLKTPCGSDETCSANADFFDYISRRNRMGPNYFPSLLYPLTPSGFEDMMPDIAFQTDDNYYLRCQDRTRDSACGVLSVSRSGDYATPLVYPALEPLYSLDALPTLSAEDLTTLFPSNGKRLLFFATVGVEGSTIISQERFQQSSFVFSNPNPLHSESLNVTFLEDIEIADMRPEPEVECTFDTFHPIYQISTYFHNLLQSLQGGNEYDGNYLNIDAKTAGVWSYLLSWTKEWQSCYSNLASFQTFGTRVTQIENTTICTLNRDLDDPCCNPQLEWSECCEGRTVEDIQNVPLFVNDDFLENNCADPSCMRTFSEDFREIYQSAISDRICLVNDEINSNISSLFELCTVNYLGEQPSYGIGCSSNGDCDFLGDPNGYCDLRAKKCVADPDLRENAFLDCLMDNMESIVKTLVYQELVKDGFADPNNATGDDFLTAQILRAYAMDGETHCFDDYGPLDDRHEYFTLRALTTTAPSTCPICGESEFLELKCLTTFACESPIQCQDVSDTCISNFVAVSPECEDPSEDSFVCNWNNNLTSQEECEEEEYKCMYCFNSSYCVPFEGISSEEECEDSPVCVLENGEVLWGVGEEECGRRQACSSAEGSSEADCLAAGSCEDPDHIFESIEALIPSYPSIATARNGVCITPLSPYNAPACPLLRPFSVNSLDFATQRGCVRIGQCFFLSGIRLCPQDPATEEDCVTRYGGKWLSLPISNQQDCENPLGVNEEDYPGYCQLSYQSEYLSPKNKGECEDCGGEAVPPARWTTPTWGEGTTVQASWRKPEMVPLYQTSASAISYFRLEELFERAARNYEDFIFWSGQSCLIYPIANLIDITACDCPTTQPSDDFDNPLSGIELDSSECRESVENDEIGTIWFCPSLDFRIGVITGVVTSLSEYVSGELCFFSEIILAPISSFVGNQPSEPVTVTNDPNELDPSPVRNQKGASVGNVLGDGIKLELSENTQPVDWKNEAQGIQLTFSIDPSFFSDNDIPTWYILDFGLEVVDSDLKTQPDDEIELRPVGATIGLSVGQQVSDFLPDGDSERFPVKVDGVLLDPFRYEKAARIYPIARLPDWEDEDKDEALSTGEQAMTGVFAGLYGIAFFVTLFFLIKGLHALTLSLLILFLYVLAMIKPNK